MFRETSLQILIVYGLVALISSRTLAVIGFSADVDELGGEVGLARETKHLHENETDSFLSLENFSTTVEMMPLVKAEALTEQKEFALEDYETERLLAEAENGNTTASLDPSTVSTTVITTTLSPTTTTLSPTTTTLPPTTTTLSPTTTTLSPTTTTLSPTTTTLSPSSTTSTTTTLATTTLVTTTLVATISLNNTLDTTTLDSTPIESTSIDSTTSVNITIPVALTTSSQIVSDALPSISLTDSQYYSFKVAIIMIGVFTGLIFVTVLVAFIVLVSRKAVITRF